VYLDPSPSSFGAERRAQRGAPAEQRARAKNGLSSVVPLFPTSARRRQALLYGKLYVFRPSQRPYSAANGQNSLGEGGAECRAPPSRPAPPGAAAVGRGVGWGPGTPGLAPAPGPLPATSAPLKKRSQDVKPTLLPNP
jgi:hypothetical protein